MIEVKSELIAIVPPEPQKKLTNYDLLLGKGIPPINQLEVMNEDDFEDFVREWACDFLSDKYVKVRRSGGAGDLGRDVIGFEAYIQGGISTWDNYQCKHYKNPLTPSTAILEIGKLCHYTFIKEFNIPKNYYFVSPKGIGPELAKLIDNPERFKERLIKEWDAKCRKKITVKKDIELKGDFKKYVLEFDFGIIKDIDPQELIEQHSRTKYYNYRFGGIVPSRPESMKPPVDIKEDEITYVKKLFDVYAEYHQKPLENKDDLLAHYKELQHFNRQRRFYYEADSLMRFERDTLPNGSTAFNELMNEVLDGVIDEVEGEYSNSYQKVKEVCKLSRQLKIYSNPLVSNLNGNDLHGICHHLANNDEINWVNKNE